MNSENEALKKEIREDDRPQFYKDIREGMKVINSGEMSEAIDYFNSLSQKWSEQPEIVFCLGIICLEYNRRGHAMSFIERAHQLDTECRDYVDALAFLYTINGKLADGLYFAKLSITLEPHPAIVPFCPPTFANYANALLHTAPSYTYFDAFVAFNQRNLATAKNFCNTELQLNPNNADCLQLLARIQIIDGDYDRSVHTLRALNHVREENPKDQAITLQALTNAGLQHQAHPLAGILVDQCWKDSFVHATLKNTLPALGESKKLISLTQKWEKRFALTRAEKPGKPFDVNEGRRVTLGFICDFAYDCDEANLLISMIAKIDQTRFRTIFYTTTDHKDTFTAQMTALFDEHRPLNDIDGYTASLTIEGDEIDILIDATIEPSETVYEIIAERPAPVQIAWQGDLSPHGSIAKDYILSDVITAEVDKKNLREGQKLVSMRNGLFVHSPMVHYPDVKVSEGVKEGHVVYGVQFEPARITSAQIGDWAQILKANPKTLLLFGNAPTICSQTQTNLVSEFGNYGLASRIRFSRYQSKDYTASGKLISKDFFLDVDILLDTSPVSGIYEVIDALWMGIPVITLRGKNREGLYASSILNSARHVEWSATTKKNYIKTAIAMAQDGEALFKLRNKLRNELLSTPLFTPDLYIKDMENTYLSIIHR